MDFGTRLKQVRKSRSMTQKNLADLLGVEQSAISNYEKNIRIPNAATIVELAHNLRVGVEELLATDESKTLTHSKTGSQEALFTGLAETLMEELLEGRELMALQGVIQGPVTPEIMAEVFHSVFEPLLWRVGSLWEEGTIDEGTEHFVSERVAALISLISSRCLRSDPRPYTALFMLPGAEEHGLALRMASELFAAQGWKTLYIGRSIPLTSLENFLGNQGVDLLVLSVTMNSHMNSAELLTRAVRNMQKVRQPLILVGGSALDKSRDWLGADFYGGRLSDLHFLIREAEQAVDRLRSANRH